MRSAASVAVFFLRQVNSGVSSQNSISMLMYHTVLGAGPNTVDRPSSVRISCFTPWMYFPTISDTTYSVRQLSRKNG